MRTGDASAEFWLRGLRHRYFCEVTSETAKRGHRYFWRVEMYDDGDEAGALVHQTSFKPCRTFADGLRLARRMADYLERVRMRRDARH